MTEEIPKMGLKKLSVFFADLCLTGAGEGAAMKNGECSKFCVRLI